MADAVLKCTERLLSYIYILVIHGAPYRATSETNLSLSPIMFFEGAVFGFGFERAVTVHSS